MSLVALMRKKKYDADNVQKSELARVLNLYDLTSMGVGSTLGLGVYVLAGEVAYKTAGPAVILSFSFAAIASAFAVLCYAEFAARVPKAGSSYIYCYVTIGEMVAFSIGWILLLEYVIGTASVARGLSGYVDAIFDRKMSSYMKTHLPIQIEYLAEYPDFFSFFIVLAMTLLLCIGVRESSTFNNIFSVVNILTILIVLIAGAIKADPANWNISDDKIPNGFGEGGFMPYGFSGVVAGASTCFYGFIGFDCVATTGEEAKNPEKNIPLAILITLIIVFLAYFGISTVLTMILPYYLQDPNAPFPHVFEQVGFIAIKWIVTIGAIFALCTSLLGTAFPSPRILYSMAQDGLLFKKLANVHPKTRTPIIATILCGSFAALLALIFDLNQLIEMMSIGTLLTYSIIAICVVILRYNYDGVDNANKITRQQLIRQLVNINYKYLPNQLSSLITNIGIVVFTFFAIIVSVILAVAETTSAPIIAVIVIFLILMILVMLIISRQPSAQETLSFKVPQLLVPFVPCLSVFVNLYLMCQLNVHTWIRLVIWMIIGYIIYFFYGIKNSVESKRRAEENLTTETIE